MQIQISLDTNNDSLNHGVLRVRAWLNKSKGSTPFHSVPTFESLDYPPEYFIKPSLRIFFILRTVLSPASRMSTWKCETALFVLTAHQQLIPQSFSLSPLNCFAKKQKQEKKIHQFIFFIAGEWSYSTLTFRVATVLIIASSALVSVRYFRFAPSADTWKLFFIKN